MAAPVLAAALFIWNPLAEVRTAATSTSPSVLAPITTEAEPTTTRSTSTMPPTHGSPATAPRPDESAQLEVVEVEYGAAVGAPFVSARDGTEALDPAAAASLGLGSDIETLSILVTVRNATDSPLLISNLIVEVVEFELLPICAEIGGPTTASYDYKFVYEYHGEGSSPQRLVESQSFEIEPQDIDSFSVPLGPDWDALGLQIVQFELWGEIPGGDEIPIAQGLHAATPVVESELLLNFTIEEGILPDLAISCADTGPQMITAMQESISPYESPLVHPSIAEWESYFSGVIDHYADS